MPVSRIIPLSELLYPNGNVELEDMSYTVMSNTTDGTLMWTNKDVDGFTFNYILSKFLIKSFLHSLYHYNKISTSILNKGSDLIENDHKKLIKKKLKKEKTILKAFDNEGIKVVKEFQDEINKAVKLYTSAFESETEMIMA